MNEVGCQRALRELLLNYESVLTHGRTRQGMPRTMQIALSMLTPPTRYYHIIPQVTDAVEASFAGKAGNQAKPRRRAYYNCVIHVSDVATPSGTADTEPYAAAHTDIRSFCEGIVAMVSGDYWRSGGTYAAYFQDLPLCIADPETDSEFSIIRSESQDRAVTVQNMDQHWPELDSEDWTPVLYSRIKFTLKEQIA